MRTLSYTPSVEAYAATSEGYIDLSQDITDCSVKINSNGASTFSLSLANRGGKYNNVFEPMDRVVIFATKGEERRKLFTGYISKVSAWTLKPTGFSISGFDTIGLLQHLYWDRHLDSSVKLMSDSVDWMEFGTGYYMQTVSLLTEVAGWPLDMIEIEREIPAEAVELARKLYSAQVSDVIDIAKANEEIYDMLMSSGANLVGEISDSVLSSGNGRDIASVAMREYDSGVADGTMHLGGKKYWSWFGWSSWNQWCAVFVSWCANQCGYLQSGVLPQTAAAQGFLDWAKANRDKAIIHHDTSYAPQPGDIVMWDWNENGTMDHVGIVVKNLGGTAYQTVEGNNSGGLGYGHDCVRSPEKKNDRYTYFVSPKYPSSQRGATSTNNGTKEL